MFPCVFLIPKKKSCIFSLILLVYLCPIIMITLLHVNTKELSVHASQPNVSSISNSGRLVQSQFKQTMYHSMEQIP
uniref:Ovule protein n=1 Tax=Caenorhabditis tropicalis TaxID=1561998 RepID=A0A1I7TPZ3_9PELO